MSEMQSDIVGNFCTPQGLCAQQDWEPSFIKEKKSSSAKHQNVLEKISFCYRASEGGVSRRPAAKKMRKERKLEKEWELTAGLECQANRSVPCLRGSRDPLTDF